MGTLGAAKNKLSGLWNRALRKAGPHPPEKHPLINGLRKSTKNRRFHPTDRFPGPRILTDISPYAFMHPLDAYASRALQGISSLYDVLEAMRESGHEERLRAQVDERCVLVTASDFAHIFDMARCAAERLDLDTIPVVYVSEDPQPGAWTCGYERPFIVIHAGLLELLEDNELYGVIAHETGHIVCRHTRYHSLATYLKDPADEGFVTKFACDYGLWFALMASIRAAELSADRAALVTTGLKRGIMGVFTKLGVECGESVRSQYDVVSHEGPSPGVGGAISRFFGEIGVTLNGLSRSHPLLQRRVDELAEWSKTARYGDIMAGRYRKVSDKQLEILSGVGRGLSSCKSSLDVLVKRIGNVAELIPDYEGALREWTVAPRGYVAGAIEGIGEMADHVGALVGKVASKVAADRTDAPPESVTPSVGCPTSQGQRRSPR